MASTDRTAISKLVLGGTALATLALGGCVVAGPTYGTDKRVGEQLIEDLGSVTTLRKKQSVIDYKPRPGLVPPPEGAALPAPQTSVAKSDAAWENSPEALRKRMAEEGNVNGVDMRSVASQNDVREIDPTTGKPISIRKRAARIGPANQRRTLSDPPVEYRQAATTAPVGDLGVPEYKKERIRAKARGQDEGGIGSKLRKLLPF